MERDRDLEKGSHMCVKAAIRWFGVKRAIVSSKASQSWGRSSRNIRTNNEMQRHKTADLRNERISYSRFSELRESESRAIHSRHFLVDSAGTK